MRILGLLGITCCLFAVRAAQHELKPGPRTVVIGHYSAQSPPALRIRSGDTVRLESVGGNPARLEEMGVKPSEIPQAWRDIVEQVKDRGPGGHTLTGPIYVEGAEPGDTLEVRIKAIELPFGYATNSFRPGAGFLPDDFPYARNKLIPLDRARGVARFGEGIEIPMKPFFGSMGVAPPAANGRISSAPPWVHAGNMDNKNLVAGSTLYIPVHVPGALFQAGDGHAGQGDGVGTFEFVVRKDLHLKWARAETPSHYIVMGFHENLTEATRIALREAIDFLVTERRLSRDDAYMLSSVAVDFSITQLVDGNKGVHGMIPKSIFKGK